MKNIGSELVTNGYITIFTKTDHWVVTNIAFYDVKNDVESVTTARSTRNYPRTSDNRERPKEVDERNRINDWAKYDGRQNSQEV